MMEYWTWHTGGAALLQTDEVLIATQSDTALYDGEKATQWKKGKVVLTTHRILYQEADGDSTLQLSLEDVSKSGETPSAVTGFAFKSDKVVLPLPGGKYTRVSFRGGGMKEFYEELRRVLQSKPWQRKAPPAPAAAASASAPSAKGKKAKDGSDDPRTTASMVGIAGVMKQSAERSHMQETFKDIDDVMAKASLLVSSIQKLKDRATASDRAASSSSAAWQEDQLAIASVEATLGLGTMVSSSGAPSHGKGQRRFHEELAKELHAWMTHPQNGKMFGEMPFVPLIELFSLYNRARSGDLVAPDDVLQACSVMTEQPYSVYTLEKLSSGRMVLMHTDNTILLSKLVALMGPMLAPPTPKASTARIGGVPKGAKTIPTQSQFPSSAAALRSVNEVQLANRLRVALPVAKDVLDSLTMQGYLCACDAGYGCSTYYWNVFLF